MKRLQAVWTLCTGLYAVACIAEMCAIWLWHQTHPGYPGVPRSIFRWEPIPMWGILVLPACVIVELLILRRSHWRRPMSWISLTLDAVATYFCVLGYR